MSAHTEGPWLVSESGAYKVIVTSGEMWAQVADAITRATQEASE